MCCERERGEILPEAQGGAGEEPGNRPELPCLKELQEQISCPCGSQATDSS